MLDNKKLKLELKKRHLSQTEFSGYLNITQGNLSRILSGRVGVNMEMILKISDILSIPVKDIQSTSDNIKSNKLSEEELKELKILSTKINNELNIGLDKR